MAEPVKTKGPYVVFRFDRHGEEVAFYSKADAEGFLESEANYFDWVNAVETENHALSSVKEVQLNHFSEIRDILAELPDNMMEVPDHEIQRVSALWRKLNDVIVRKYNQEKALHSSEAVAAFARRLFRSGKEELSLGVIGKWSGMFQEIPQPHASEIDKHLKAFEGGFHYLCLDAAAESFQNIRYNNGYFLNKLRAEQDDFYTYISESESRLRDYEKAYQEQVKLKSPKAYWEKIAKRNGWGFAVYAAIIGGAGYFTYWVLYHLAVDEWGIFSSPREASGIVLSKELSSAQIATFALVILFAVWLLRIQTRLMLGHAHVRADALERVAMIDTYVSMVRDGDIKDEKERVVLLGSLFRPSTTGIVKDDASPFTWHNVIQGRLQQ